MPGFIRSLARSSGVSPTFRDVLSRTSPRQFGVIPRRDTTTTAINSREKG